MTRHHARILVTGIGGQPGFDTARRLIQLGCTVIGVDADPHANGLHLAGVIPRVCAHVEDPAYADQLLGLCRGEQVDALVSTVEQELPQLVPLAPALERIGVRSWLPPLASVTACTDKDAFHRIVTAAGIATPATWLPEQLDTVPVDAELVIKPRRGQGSQGVIFCRGRDQAQAACQVVADPIVQARIRGREFTADCLIDRDGRISVILRERLLTKGGLAFVTRTTTNPLADAAVRATLTAVEAIGLVCVQGFLTDHTPAHQRVLITEVNARPAGAFLAAEAAGADLIGQLLAGLLGDPVDHTRLTYRPGVTLTKYIDTLTVTNGANHAAAQ
ncbi:ATP-grasp domain-containing protein [Nocardia xishanensis]|uniref:ATP-grasp domain-containing protein n=1 Tax=Nocardia xishanensis TaxID=238964 RepID=UPI0033D7ED84